MLNVIARNEAILIINCGPAINYKCTFNPIDNIVELYERMLKDKDAMMEELSCLTQGLMPRHKCL